MKRSNFNKRVKDDYEKALEHSISEYFLFEQMGSSIRVAINAALFTS